MTMTHVQLERLQPILQELGNKKHPMLAYRLTMLGQLFEPFVKAIQAARVPATEFQEFSNKHTGLCESLATRDDKGKPIKRRVPVPEQNGWVDNYDIADPEAYQLEFAALKEEYKDAIEEESERQQKVIELLNSEVDLELKYRIKYSWCKELLSANILTPLLECGILIIDEDLDDEEDEEDETEDKGELPEASEG